MSGQLETVALELIKAAATIAPSVDSWLRAVTAGRADPISRRVEAILPKVSKSEQALEELRRPRK